MNDVGLTMLGAAGRVTLLALAAVPACAAASRRGPRAGAAAATAALAGCVALTLLAFCPLPDWWSWHAPAPAPPSPAPAAAADDVAPPATAEAADESHMVDMGDLLRGLWHRASVPAAPPSPSAGRWPALLTAAVLLGAGLGVLRLAVGLWAVARWRRRSRPVCDAGLLRLTEELRAALGCRRPLALRESDAITVPATAGWLWPLVLLPADWPAWDEGDLRAVLAHELAHVSRSDYLAGLLARLGVALHFYHPLVRWLAGRLRLEQELAADELGARLAGGRGPYLRALARLALRRDGLSARPGRAFLSAGGTLERRIQMLRTSTSGPERTTSWPGRVAAGLLLAAAVVASGLRGTAPKAEAAPPPAPAQPARPDEPQQFGVPRLPVLGPVPIALDFGFPVVAAETAPFDLSALPPDAKGVWAFRPAAVFGQPGMKKHADQAGELRTQVCKEFLHLDLALVPAIADIEQVVGTVRLEPQKDGHTALLADARLIRTTHDFDWKKLLGGLFPKAVEVRAEGGSYYRVPGDGAPEFLAPFRSEKEESICYQVADARTVVFGSAADMRRRLSAKKAEAPKFAWAAEWKAVERDLMAAAYDGHDKGWLDPRPKKADDTAERALIDIAERTSAMAFGLGAGDGLSMTVAVGSPTADEAKQVLRLVADLFKEGGALRAELEAAGDDKAADDQLSRALLKADWKVSQTSSREDRCTTWRCHSSMSFSALVEAMTSEGERRP